MQLYRRLRTGWLCGLAFFFNSVYAQTTDAGNWFIYFGSQKIAPRINLWNEVQYRNYNFAGDLQQLLVRAGIGYDLSKDNNNLLLGYGFIRSSNYDAFGSGKTNSNEHRIYQQFLTKQRFGRFYIGHRYRFEERFIAEQFSTRFRYFVNLNLPVNKPEMAAGAIYFTGYNEIFLNTRPGFFDRNRLYGGLGYVFGKNIKTEIAYMNQRTNGNSRNQFQIVLFNNLPIYKPDKGFENLVP